MIIPIPGGRSSFLFCTFNCYLQEIPEVVVFLFLLNQIIMKTLNLSKRYRNLTREKDDLIRSNPLLKSIGLSTKNQTNRVLLQENKQKTYINLCPLYDMKWWVECANLSFSQVQEKYRKKFEATMAVVRFLDLRFDLDLNFLIADKWMAIDPKRYDMSRLDEDVSQMAHLYSEAITDVLNKDFKIDTFSWIWVPIDRVNTDLWSDITYDDYRILLEWYGIDYYDFYNSLDIIIRNFWMIRWYFLVKNYLETNRFFTENYADSIFVNTETTSSKNNLFACGKYRLNENNLFVKVDINSVAKC